MRKLAVWGKVKLNLVKDETTQVYLAKSEEALKRKGRRTLRLEEIQDPREFFDCIGQVGRSDAPILQVDHLS